jgi:chorismate mutase
LEIAKAKMKDKKAMKSWISELNFSHPLVIAGPCSAETEEQVLKTALELKGSSVSIFRAGIWKPRTRPGGFEGVGEIGLKWLQKAKAETGLLMAIEVANAHHVQLALEHDIDVLWIGARTTVNPFAVQEIADALQNTDKIVLVKNPVNPDLSLWIGAVERLHNAGIKKLGIIHRGFSTYEKTKYRNNPEWQIAIDMQHKYANLPFIIDPSHITGKRDMIFQVTQEALDLNYDGMIIETHIDPDNAWSDAAQQVTPTQLKDIVSNLIIRKETDETDDYQQNLLKLRLQIDEFDSKLLEVIGKRMKVAENIGALKKEKNVAVLQNKRWNEVLEKMISDGSQKGLSEEFIIQFFKAIHQESIAHQEKVFNS